MNRVWIAAPVGILMVLVAFMATTIIDARDEAEGLMVEVSLTNLTHGQIMSPVFIARHDSSADYLYNLGHPASDALAAMAEDAEADGLLEAWDPESNGSVGQAMVLALDDGPIPPGKTVTTTFDINDGKSLVSLASMLVSTNDAFVGANGIDMSRSQTIMLNAYDSGSEANSENCDYVPGPPCGNHVEDEADAEGFVHVHNGIHGMGDSGLNPAIHDWNNPVARLTIKSWKMVN